MSEIRMVSNAAQVAELVLRARFKVDPAVQEELIPLGKELVDVEKRLAPKGRNHRGRSQTLEQSIHLKVGRLAIQSVTYKRYAKIIDEGGRTGAHDILPKTKAALAFGGIVVKSVHHPGSHYKAQHYAARALETMEPKIVEGMEQAVLRSINRTIS